MGMDGVGSNWSTGGEGGGEVGSGESEIVLEDETEVVLDGDRAKPIKPKVTSGPFSDH